MIIAGAGAICGAQDAALPGSVTGKITDKLSAPIANAALTLRNEETGIEQHAASSRDGRYDFAALPAGDYTLTATNSQGTGQIAGIHIASGHRSRVTVAIELRRLSVEQAQTTREQNGIEGSTAAGKLDARLRLRIKPAIPTAFPQVAAIELPAVEQLSLHLPGRSLPTPTSPDPSKSATLPAGIPPGSSIAASVSEIPAKGRRSGPGDASPVEVSQLQALPIPGRDWRNFVLEDHGATVPTSGDQSTENTSAAPSEITVDGARIQLAFGRTGNAMGRNLQGVLISPGSTETQLGNVQSDSVEYGARRANFETQRGSQGLHGQVFLFDRQNLLGARNPLTQWVHETTPATHTTLPVFTPIPVSAGDREALWGVGLGGIIKKRQLLWFLALDGEERINPSVSTVKHAENFFAQPSNDQMQLLSAQLGLSSADPVSEGVAAYSKLLESLVTLLGPAQRSSSQWTGFGRIDWNLAERHRFTLETSGARLNSPGGGFTRASEFYGSHSFGSMRAVEQWALGRWETFVTPNLLVVTQGSVGRQVQHFLPEKPSSYEQLLNVNAWGQLPQIVIDSRYGFTIGNPARLQRGSYPDENLYHAQEQVNWVRGQFMVKAGFELSHNRDATSQLRNQTGTYYYSNLEDFASDALAFSAFGIAGQLNPLSQHNCDQRGKAWRDTEGVLHGLGYLPCYSYYSQTMGPSNWWLSTNDWAGFVSTQWQPSRQTAFTLAMRWELEQLPPPISLLDNPELPLTQRLPHLGNQWGPRAAFAWGTGEGHWPVLRFGYGMYFARTRNAVVESVLTHTGSLKGDLNFFLRPTDNLYGGGAPPFPYVFQGEPATAVKPGAAEFASNFRNGEVHQAEFAMEEELPGRIHLEASAMASLGRRLPAIFDANIDPAANPKTITYAVTDGNFSGPIRATQITVPFFASWPSSTGFQGRLNPNYQQISEVFSRANSTYEAATLRAYRSIRSFTFRARYTYGHAADWNPDETSQVGGPSVLDPIDYRQEYGTSNLDVRHSLHLAVVIEPKWRMGELGGALVNGWMLSSVGSFRSGMPYTMRTAGSIPKEFDYAGSAIVALSTSMNGYGGDNRVYGVGRNTFRYPATWKADLRLARKFHLGQMRQLELLAESFNLFNHQNVTELETTGYTIESGTANGTMPRLNYLTGLKTGQIEFGKPLNINATDFYRERRFQFGARMRF